MAEKANMAANYSLEVVGILIGLFFVLLYNSAVFENYDRNLSKTLFLAAISSLALAFVVCLLGMVFVAIRNICEKIGGKE